MKTNSSPWPICLLMTAIAVLGVFCSQPTGRRPT